MEIGPVKPVDDGRNSKELGVQNRPSQQARKDVSGGVAAKTETPVESPDTEGVLGTAEAESGSIRNANEQAQQKDRQAQLVEFVDRLSGGRSVGNTKLSIEIEPASQQPRFLVLHRDTGEVIREIPEQEFLDSLRKLSNKGFLIDTEF